MRRYLRQVFFAASVCVLPGWGYWVLFGWIILQVHSKNLKLTTVGNLRFVATILAGCTF